MVQKMRRRARISEGRGRGAHGNGELPRNTPARQKILDSYLHGAREVVNKDEEELVLTADMPLRWKNPKGYQATDEVQVPKPKFPSTLATIVLVFEIDDEWREMLEYIDQNKSEPPKTGEGAIAPSYARMNMQPLVDKLRSADMIVREAYGNERKFFYCLVSISEKRQKAVAEVMGDGALRLRLKKKDDMGNTIKNGGGWTGFKQHLSHLYERSSEGSLFSSAQQQQIMMFMLNDVDERAMGPQLIQKEACELGNTPMEQLIVDERIVTYYCLHHEKKLAWMDRNWMRNYTGKQPIETIREYYGEEIAMQCVFTGYIAKSLWVPATVGIVLFFVQIVLMAEKFEIDNPWEMLYALYIAVWTIQLSAGWKSLQLVYELEWGTVDIEVTETERPEFLQNPRTYKRLNTVSKREEFFPDPLWRGVSVVLSLVVFILLMGMNVSVVMGLELLKSLVSQQLGESGHVFTQILGSMMQAACIQAFRLGLIPVFDWLTYQENWKLMSEYNASMAAKRMCFGFFNSYFAIIFVMLLANEIQLFGVDISCPGHKCMGYVEVMIAIIFVQQFVVRFGFKTIKPYYDWQALEDAELEHEKNKLTPAREQHEKEYKLTDMPTLELEYASKVLELGYFCLFGAVFPMLGIFVLLATLVEIRGAAFNLNKLYQRPLAKMSKRNATWQITLDILAIVSIILQCCFIGFVSDGILLYFPGSSLIDQIFIVLVLEHGLLLFKILWDARAGIPHEVQLAYERKNYERDELLSEFDTEDFHHTVAFYTSDEGDLFYSKVQS